MKKIDVKLNDIVLEAKDTIFQIITLARIKWILFIQKIIGNQKWKRCFGLILLGFLNILACVPFSIVIVLPLTFGALMYIFFNDFLQGKSAKKLTNTLFFFTLGHFIGIFWWFAVPLTIDYHFYWMIPFAIIGIPTVIALLFSVFYYIGIKLWLKFVVNNKHKRIYEHYKIIFLGIFILSWSCADFVRGHFIMEGFPWMMFCHFLPYSFAIQSVRLFGVDTFSAFVMMLVFVPYMWYFIKDKHNFAKNISIIILAFWVVNIIVGLCIVHFASRKTLPVNIIASQTNEKASLFQTYNQAVENVEKNYGQVSWISILDKPTLILMPEGTVPYDLTCGDETATYLSHALPNISSLLLTGGLHFKGMTPYNVVFALNKTANVVSTYNKHKLAPFGEYIPLRWLFPKFVRTITGGMQDFKTDLNNQFYISYRELPYIYPVICYEAIFTSWVKKNIKNSRKEIDELDKKYGKERSMKTRKERGEVIVDFTNDAWMSWSSGSHQHFLMSRFLAVYTHLPVVRVSNNGVSAYIDEYGVVHEHTKLNRPGMIFINNAQ